MALGEYSIPELYAMRDQALSLSDDASANFLEKVIFGRETMRNLFLTAFFSECYG